MAAWGRVPRPLLALVARRRGRRGGRRSCSRGGGVPTCVPGSCRSRCSPSGCVICVDIHWQHFSGAAVFGWSLVWGLVMLPYRALGFGISHHLGWWVGFVALARLRRAHRRRRRLSRPQRDRPALGRAPRRGLLDRLAAARRADRRSSARGRTTSGTSTSASTSTTSRSRRCSSRAAPRCCSRRGSTPMRLSLAGCALSVATATKLSNALLAAAALVVVFLRGRNGRRAAVPRGRARVRAGRARLLAEVVPEAVRQHEARGRWIRSTRRTSCRAGRTRPSSRRTRSRSSCRSPSSAPGACAARGRSRSCSPSSLLNPVFYSFYANTAEHPALPLREPAGAVRALGRRHRRPRLARSAAACSGRGRPRLVKTLRTIAVGWVVLLAACSLPNVGLWNPNGKADTGLYSLYGSRIAHGHLPYRSGFSMEFPPGAIPPLALPALPGSHYVAVVQGPSPSSTGSPRSPPSRTRSPGRPRAVATAR